MISPKILLWGNQSYGRERSGFFGIYHPSLVSLIPMGLQHLELYERPLRGLTANAMGGIILYDVDGVHAIKMHGKFGTIVKRKLDSRVCFTQLEIISFMVHGLLV